MFSSETGFLQRAHPWVGDTICGSDRRRQIIFYTNFAFYLSIIDEDGPDDLVFDVPLLDDDLAVVSPSVAKVLPLESDSSQSIFGRNKEHISFLFQIGRTCEIPRNR